MHDFFNEYAMQKISQSNYVISLFAGWFWADKPGWCWFVLREKYCTMTDKPWLNRLNICKLCCQKFNDQVRNLHKLHFKEFTHHTKGYESDDYIIFTLFKLFPLQYMQFFFNL